jgi:hypothetical protein
MTPRDVHDELVRAGADAAATRLARWLVCAGRRPRSPYEVGSGPELPLSRPDVARAKRVLRELLDALDRCEQRDGRPFRLVRGGGG